MLFFILFLLVLASFVIWPQMDLVVSDWFYQSGGGFVWQGNGILQGLNIIAVDGSRVLAGLLAVAVAVAYWRRRDVCALPGKAWLFLLVALLLGPGLVANVVFKDHWGRARPREVAQFGGQATFTRPLVMAQQCDSNCSFVSGDGAFGFFLPSLAYVVSPKRRRVVFWGMMGLGGVFSAARVMMGAHFVSDTLFAAFFMLLVSALLCGLFYGRARVRECWREWLG